MKTCSYTPITIVKKVSLASSAGCSQLTASTVAINFYEKKSVIFRGKMFFFLHAVTSGSGRKEHKIWHVVTDVRGIKLLKYRPADNVP